MTDRKAIEISPGELAAEIAKMPRVSFTNEHGEHFTISSNGLVVFLSGDEVDQMVDDKHKIDGKYIPLFNSHFSIWSQMELASLGHALQELHTGAMQFKEPT